jgi:hypothetical protein
VVSNITPCERPVPQARPEQVARSWNQCTSPSWPDQPVLDVVGLAGRQVLDEAVDGAVAVVLVDGHPPVVKSSA